MAAEASARRRALACAVRWRVNPGPVLCSRHGRAGMSRRQIARSGSTDQVGCRVASPARETGSEPTELSGTAALTGMRGAAPGLRGVSGRLRLQVANASAGVLQVDPSGAVAIAPGDGSQTVIAVDTHQTLLALLRGELSPVVAALQDRLKVEGDLWLALRVLMGLQGDSPWKKAANGGSRSCSSTR